MKKSLLIIIGISTLIGAFGQKQGYMVVDKVKLDGVLLQDGGERLNSAYCQEWRMGIDSVFRSIKLDPYEVSEYGFGSSIVYRSREIRDSAKIKRVFLRLHVDGEMRLYSYSGHRKTRFYIEMDSSGLIELPRENTYKDRSYKEILYRSASDCDLARDASDRVAYNEVALSRFTNYYNQCEMKPYPIIRFGLFVGYERSNLFLHDESHSLLHGLDFSSRGGITAGMFVDQALRFTYFSLYSELRYSQYSYEFYNTQDRGYIDFNSSAHALSIPIMLRYMLPKDKYSPYFCAGGLYTFNMVNEYSIYRTDINDNVVNTVKVSSDGFISDHNYGFVAGGGIKVALATGRSVICEIRYCRSSGRSGINELGISSYMFLIGLEL